MSSKIQGITVEIGGDTTQLGNALKGVNDKAKNLQTELKGVNTLLKMDPGNVTLLKQKQDLLNQSISECKEKLNTLKSTQEQVQQQFEKGDITAEQYREFQREIVATEQKLKSLTEESKRFGSVTTQQIAAVGEKTKELGSNLENSGKKMLKATATVGALGTASVFVGKNFDDSMKQVAATMGITVDEINNGSESYKILENAAKQSGETTKFSASEAAEALNYLALAGYDAEKSAETLPKVLNLAAAGGLDLASASDMVTDAMAALGMESNQLDKYIDEMAKTSQKSNTSVSQLGEATLACAGTVKMSGMSLETMNTELGILANNGIKGAEGGTHLRNIILSLSSPTDSASKALKKLGIDILDSQGNMKDMNVIMSEFNQKLDGMSNGDKTEIISTIFNKTDIAAVNALIKGSGEEFAKLNAEINNCDGSAQNMADTMNSSLGGQATLLKSQLEGIAIQFSEILAPVIKKVIDKVSELLTWFSNLSPSTKKIIVVIGAMVAAIGPLLITIGKLTTSIGSIMTFGPKILSGFGTIKTAIGNLFKLMLANPVIAIITAIIAAIMLLWNNCEGFRNLVIGIFESIKTALGVAWEWISGVFNTIGSTISIGIENIKMVFSNLWSALVTIFTPVVEFFQNIWNGIVNIFSSVGGWFGARFSEAWNAIRNVFSGVGNFFGNIWNTIKNMFTQIGTTVGNAIGGAFRNVVNTIISFAENTINGFIRAINWAIGAINHIPGVNIQKLNELNIPKLNIGMDYVPYDNYLALLHKGERVMTAKENKEYGKNLNETTKVITNDNAVNLKIENFYNNRPQDIQGLGEELGFYSLKVQRAKGG